MNFYVEQEDFETELKNEKYIYLNKNGIKNVIKILNNKDKEIERLNNIINEIEKDLLDRYYGRGKYHLSTDIIGIPTFYKRIKELKGSESNENKSTI